MSEKLLCIKKTFANLLSALDKKQVCEHTVLFTPLEISTLSFIFLLFFYLMFTGLYTDGSKCHHCKPTTASSYLCIQMSASEQSSKAGQGQRFPLPCTLGQLHTCSSRAQAQSRHSYTSQAWLLAACLAGGCSLHALPPAFFLGFYGCGHRRESGRI